MNTRSVQVKGNYFSFVCSKVLFRYKITTEPEISSTKLGLLYAVLSTLKDQLTSIFKPYQPVNWLIYSLVQIQEVIVLTTSLENLEYAVRIQPSGMLEIKNNERESTAFMGRLFKNAQRNLKLKPVNRKYFDPNGGQNFPKWKLSVWPGYQTSLNYYQDQILVNIDTCYKVIRETTVYEFMTEVARLSKGNQQRIKDTLLGMIVMTKYNNFTYRIDGIDFDKNANDFFITQDGEEISYVQYYEKKYNRKLKYLTQPLLISSKGKGNMIIHLLPELCVLTGQSKDMKQNFQLQKDLNVMMKPKPVQRLESAQELISRMEGEERVNKLFEDWHMAIKKEPLAIFAEKFDAGHIVMGNETKFPLEETVGFDRKIQTEMLEQPQIKKIGVFHSSKDKESVNVLMGTLKECVRSFNYPMDEPRLFEIHGKKFEDWEKALKMNIDPSVQAVILLMPGTKKKGEFYNECKKLLVAQCPIPCQVILTSTIMAGKNLRSIVNKLLMQICAKVGGTPWSVSDFPFTEKPTMLVGIDVFHNTIIKKDSQLAFCATMNKYFSRYWSTCDVHRPGEEIGKGVQTAVKDAILAFKETNNGIFPRRIIVYRDGVSESQRRTLAEIEVKAFLRAFDALFEEGKITVKPDFAFICVNKSPAAKFYMEKNKGDFLNPEPGTAISKAVTTGRDFYLISQKVNEGTVKPTHYAVLAYWETVNNEYIDKTYEISENMMSKLVSMTYKMCYMYFNWSGSIKTPAPLQYAHRLAGFIGDMWKPNEPFIPHHAFKKMKNLYFI